MHDRHDDIFGRRIERRVMGEIFRDDVFDTDFDSRQVAETIETSDGTLEVSSLSHGTMHTCGHAHRPGQDIVRCEASSQKARRAVYVCPRCAFTCPVSGQTLCLKCGRLGPDGRRYSPEGLKQAERMGFFDRPTRAPDAGPRFEQPSTRVVCAPRRGKSLWQSLVEWW